ncbi:hypothetical protein EXIGLDRAFT_494405 [Exidia glandulosa HHB12029]|uniref:Uncharacterized protein n=1 Tax=Exidia glandulosa HHB12029 TaxID=1314781 RepID=A0A165JJM9_EXIGL|nr:hypothetical protein EXIGLDRAFT_494405 [Exidia glandulosa HHB12029]
MRSTSCAMEILPRTRVTFPAFTSTMMHKAKHMRFSWCFHEGTESIHMRPSVNSVGAVAARLPIGAQKNLTNSSSVLKSHPSKVARGTRNTVGPILSTTMHGRAGFDMPGQATGVDSVVARLRNLNSEAFIVKFSRETNTLSEQSTPSSSSIWTPERLQAERIWPTVCVIDTRARTMSPFASRRRFEVVEMVEPPLCTERVPVDSMSNDSADGLECRELRLCAPPRWGRPHEAPRAAADWDMEGASYAWPRKRVCTTMLGRCSFGPRRALPASFVHTTHSRSSLSVAQS